MLVSDIHLDVFMLRTSGASTKHFTRGCIRTLTLKNTVIFYSIFEKRPVIFAVMQVEISQFLAIIV